VVVGSCSTGEARGLENCKKLQGLVARGGAHRGVADGGGARPESTRESGLLMAGGCGPCAGSGGEARALERRSQRGVEMGGRVEQREREASGSAAARQRGKEEGKGGGPSVGVPRGAAVPWGLAPTSGRHPIVARARCSRVTCAARALPAETERGEASDGWAAAQCRAAVSLTGGAGLSACAGRARVARRRAWAGPRRKRGGQAQMNSKVSHLFELV
jgi:hypothetical protein